MPRMPRYNRDTHKLEWVEVEAAAPEYLAWKEKARSAGRRGAAKSKAKASSSTSETLENDGPTPEPTGPKRAAGGANSRPQSMLAPVLPRIAQSLVIGIRAATHNLTSGRAPMSEQEAVAIAVPAVRIADRTAAKYIRKTGKVTPNQEDAALIVLTIVVWAAGWLLASLSKKPRQAVAAPQPAGMAANVPDDLFAGSEPVTPPSAPAPRSGAAPSPAAMTGAGDGAAPFADDGDLFVGSEPISPGDAAQAAPIRARVNPQQAAATERIWQAITPTDMGETLAG